MSAMSNAAFVPADSDEDAALVRRTFAPEGDYISQGSFEEKMNEMREQIRVEMKAEMEKMRQENEACRKRDIELKKKYENKIEEMQKNHMAELKSFRKSFLHYEDRCSYAKKKIEEFKNKAAQGKLSTEELVAEMNKLMEEFPGDVNSSKLLDDLFKKAGVKKEDLDKAAKRITKNKSPNFDWTKFFLLIVVGGVGGAFFGWLLPFLFGGSMVLTAIVTFVGGGTGACIGAGIGWHIS
uniref:uncharacterized protein LOC120334242 isoform X2 n=1 Tax=Styela clava TaxID=7725 RepID=UPI001939F4EC|nr:uncharacterized protein LOC120334242 isoform X2 [Styela clava]